MNGAHILKAGGHTRLLGTSKSGRLEITEDSITRLRRHSVDMGASAPTYSSIKSDPTCQDCGAGLDDAETHVLPLQSLHGGAGPTATQYWRTLRARDSGRSYGARAGILGQDFVLLQARNHNKDEERSGNTTNEQSRIEGAIKDRTR